ncbi:small ribosomal subunit protein bS18m [Prorops nasuta]|uniref:small ribosomal subunit protein bS18m n=1 Tax=Prorops nasuta TaxID=863751 RepID=UPI0034CF4BC5
MMNKIITLLSVQKTHDCLLTHSIVRATCLNLKRFKSSIVADAEVNKTQELEDDMPIELEVNPFEKPKEKCILCKLNVTPDYKNVRLLSQFQSQFTGRIYGRHITGLCKYKQKMIETEIYKAQVAGLMSHMTKDPKYFNDPELFDPNHPFRPHKY